jgi:hypothetical protein
LFVADQGAGDQQTPSGRAAVSVQGAGPTAASSAVASAANTASGVGGPRECVGCGKRITERYLLKVKCLPACTNKYSTRLQNAMGLTDWGGSSPALALDPAAPQI